MCGDLKFLKNLCTACFQLIDFFGLVSNSSSIVSYASIFLIYEGTDF